MNPCLSRRAMFGAFAAPFVLSSFGASADQMPAGYVSVAEFGAKGDGVTDDTESLGRAHASGKPLYYSATGAFYRISHVLPVGASALSNGAEIRIKGDGRNPTTIFRIVANTSPITISGFVLDGGYKGGTQGEWSHGIDVSGATDVTIARNTIRNPYGDCVFVDSVNTSGVAAGSVKGPRASSNIRVLENRLINPRRCNVAVVCGENVVIEGNICVKESEYVAAIDLEPDVNRFDYVRRVRIANNRYTTSGKFISAAINNGLENTGLLIEGNRGEALQFFHGHSDAHLRAMTITRNKFSATSPKGVMLYLEKAEGIISDNVDGTACADGYQSVSFRDCKIRLERNQFCL